MKIAVTGATGHLGTHVIHQLLEKTDADNIIAIVRNADKAAPFAERGVDVRVADYNDLPALKTALAGVDRLLLISASEIGKRFEQHKNVIDAAKASGVQHILYTSAPRATTSKLVLAPEHKSTEEYIFVSGLTYTILRNNWYTENYLGQIDTARQTGEIVSAAGEGRVASATRADYAAGAVAVLLGSGHENKVYELGGDTAWNFHELAAAIGEIIGKPVEYKPVDTATMTNILKSVGMDEGAAGFWAALDGNIADGALAEVTGDLSTLIERPTTPLKEGLLDAMKH